MNWYKKAQYSMNSKQGWILPSGKIVYVGFMAHEVYFTDHYQEFGIKKMDRFDVEHPYDGAYRTGAVRFDIDAAHKDAGITGYKQSIKKHISALMDLLAQFRVDRVYLDDTTNPKKYVGKSYSTIEDFQRDYL